MWLTYSCSGVGVLPSSHYQVTHLTELRERRIFEELVSGFGPNKNLQPTSLHLQDLPFQSGFTQIQIIINLDLPQLRLGPPSKLMCGGIVVVSFTLPVLEVSLIIMVPNPLVHPFRLLEDWPGRLWLRDGHRVEPKSAKVGRHWQDIMCLLWEGSTTAISMGISCWQWWHSQAGEGVVRGEGELPDHPKQHSRPALQVS